MNLSKSTKPIIAVVGLSNRPDRPSYDVSAYMQRQGYRIVAVNPMYAGTQILGEACYASLTEAAQALGSEVKVDIVNCFRKSADIPPVVDEAIAIGAKCIWMQLGIINTAAADKAKSAGLQVIMNRCIKVDHSMGMTHGVL